MWIVILLLITPVAIGVIGYIYDYIDWNRGICPKCGKEWEYFDTDSAGGRGYKCACRHIWISYNVDYKTKK